LQEFDLATWDEFGVMKGCHGRLANNFAFFLPQLFLPQVSSRPKSVNQVMASHVMANQVMANQVMAKPGRIRIRLVWAAVYRETPARSGRSGRVASPKSAKRHPVMGADPGKRLWQAEAPAAVGRPAVLPRRVSRRS